MYKISPIAFVLLLLLPTVTGVGAQTKDGTIKATVLDQGKALIKSFTYGTVDLLKEPLTISVSDNVELRVVLEVK